MAKARADWKAEQASFDPSKLISLMKPAPTQRWFVCMDAARREPASFAHKLWTLKTTTFTAGLRHGGLIAPFILDGPVNCDAFLVYLDRILVLVLAPGGIVAMNNLPAHKVAGVRKRIEAAAAKLLYLPPYSPGLNPIEMVFTKFKSILRKAAGRTLPALWGRTGKCSSADDFALKSYEGN